MSAQLVAQDLRVALDPALMGARLGLDLDPWQVDVLRAAERQMILCCSRQSGKSTVSSLLALHEAMYRSPALVLLLSPSLRQSQELFRKVMDAYHGMGEAAVPVAEESALRLELTNGSRIIALPGKEATIRGYSGVSLLIEDEASRVPDDLYQAIRPMLAVSGGKIVLLSTPWGKRGHFFVEWSQGGPEWKRVEITAHGVPRISPEWLQAERRAIGDLAFRQEYMCEFVETEDALFSYDDIESLTTTEVEPYTRKVFRS